MLRHEWDAERALESRFSTIFCHSLKFWAGKFERGVKMFTFLVCLPTEQVISDSFMTHPESPLPSPMDPLRSRVDAPVSDLGRQLCQTVRCSLPHSVRDVCQGWKPAFREYNRQRRRVGLSIQREYLTPPSLLRNRSVPLSFSFLRASRNRPRDYSGGYVVSSTVRLFHTGGYLPPTSLLSETARSLFPLSL